MWYFSGTNIGEENVRPLNLSFADYLFISLAEKKCILYLRILFLIVSLASLKHLINVYWFTEIFTVSGTISLRLINVFSGKW